MGCNGSKQAHRPSKEIEEPRVLLGRRVPAHLKEGRMKAIALSENEEMDPTSRYLNHKNQNRAMISEENTEWSDTSSFFLEACQTSLSSRRRLVPKGQLKDSPGARSGARGRHYNAVRASQQGGIRIEDLMLGVKLACLAYTDDQRGTLDNLGGTRKAIETLAGGPERARRPLTEILQALGFTVDRIFSHTAMLGSLRTVDTHGFIAHNDQDVVISYRGTTGIVEWLTDLAASPIPFQPNLDQEKSSSSCLAGRQSQPQAHQGFYDAFLASVCDINQKLMPQLRDTSRPKRLIIAGHSIGGAIAMGALGYLLQSFDFASSPHRILFVSTGQPRFGDDIFASWLDKQLASLRRAGKCCAVRLVNDCDAVPTVPASGYRHAGKLCLLTSEGELLIGPEVEERDVGTLAEGVDEHRTDNYLNLLASIAT
ncbi:unnamed protein product [Effrenium voratum]|uniref:Fungal lipase-type domain-containing protein n=1 Tax=Effrenium voratum TaxID=2562239 RepID=A0AA36HSA6_9DINO|nr:unnamed protein product [Effrenium voratum]CAJ1419611.1 unnamed protein product [Effrenium voratum]